MAFSGSDIPPDLIAIGSADTPWDEDYLEAVLANTGAYVGGQMGDDFLMHFNANLSVADSSIPNCTCGGLDLGESPANYQIYNFFLIIILIPITASFGYFGNICSAYIYGSRPLRQQSSNVYLASLAVSDLVVLSTGILFIWLDSARGLIAYFDWFARKALQILATAHMCQMISVYVTIGASIDGFIRVCGTPRQKALFCRPVVAFLLVIMVVIISVLFHLVRFWMFKVRECRKWNILVYQFQPQLEVCITTVAYYIGKAYGVYGTSLVMVIFPFGMLTVLTFIIIKQVISDKRNHRGTSGDSVSTLVLVALLFLFCNILTVISTIMEGFMEVHLINFHFVSDMGNYLVIFNASVNVLIYLRFDKAYRENFVKKICHVKVRTLKKTVSYDQECQVSRPREMDTLCLQNPSLKSEGDNHPLLSTSSARSACLDPNGNIPSTERRCTRKVPELVFNSE